MIDRTGKPPGKEVASECSITKHHDGKKMPRSRKAVTRGNSDSGKIDLGLLPGLLGYQIRLAQIAIFRDFASALGEHDMTPGLFGILIIVEANPGLKQAELARAAHLDRSTVVSIIDKLEKRGLVKRHYVENDRRSNALQLTEEGAQLLDQIKEKVAEHERRLVDNLSETEQAELVKLLKKILPDLR